MEYEWEDVIGRLNPPKKGLAYIPFQNLTQNNTYNFLQLFTCCCLDLSFERTENIFETFQKNVTTYIEILCRFFKKVLSVLLFIAVFESVFPFFLFLIQYISLLNTCMVQCNTSTGTLCTTPVKTLAVQSNPQLWVTLHQFLADYKFQKTFIFEDMTG